MKKLIVISSIFISLSGFGQIKGAPEELFECWSASIEEDNEKTHEKVFRHCDYKFPPIRYRATVKLNKDGTCTIVHLGESDKQTNVTGKWTYNKKKKRVVVTNPDQITEMKFRIKTVDKEKLQVISEM